MIRIVRPGRAGVAVLATVTSATLAACGSSGSAAPADGAAVEPARLAAFEESFGFLQAVREMPDGRVLVADPLGGILVLLDMERGTMEPVGREGSGPGEWRQPDAVYAMPGDSTLLVDLGNARLSVLDAAGNISRSYPIALASEVPAGDAGRGPATGPGQAVEIVNPRATDASGRVYFQARPRLGVTAGEGGSAPDSAEVRRWEPGSPTSLRIAGLRPSEVRTSSSGSAGNTRVMTRPVPLSPQDDWAVAEDGRIALVRAEPYRVEWLQADGTLRSGPPVEYQPVSITDAEKERWNEATGSGGLAISMTIENGMTSMQMQRGGGRRAEPSTGGQDDLGWPATLPAFRAGAARVDPYGRVWVERYDRVGQPTLYDLFDANGVRTTQVRLPADRRVIGFGADRVYTARTDEFGLQWLEAYEMPARS